MKTTKLKQQNAITLVALIITIIVLLILAMVSISLVINSGIITKSKDSVDKYSAEEITEQLKLAYSEYQMAVYSEGANDATAFVKARLQETFGDKLDANSVSVADGKVTAKINGTTYEYNTATGTAGEKKPGLGDLVTKDNYGDYINLGTNILSDKPSDWRILYNDKAGHVYAILADYLPNTNPAVDSAGFNRSMETSKTYNVYGRSRDDLLAKLTHETAWNSLIPNDLVDKGANVVGATTGDIIIASYNEKYNVSPAKNYTNTPWLYIDNDSTKGIDQLYILYSRDGCFGYWLASSYADNNSDLYTGDYRGPIYHDIYNSSGNGLRPVVSLPSNLQVTNNGGVWSLANN